MSEEPNSQSHNYRLALALWVVGVTAYFLLAPGSLLVNMLFLKRAAQVGAAVIIIGGAAAAGSRLLRTLIPDTNGLERILCGTALGLGILMTLILIVAHISTALLMGVFILCGFVLLIFRRELALVPRIPGDVFTRTVLFLILLVVIVSIVSCWIPPFDYDVLEYHLGAPAEYIKAGRMHFLPHNMYSSLPGNVEMLYLTALETGGMPYRGAAIARVMNVILVCLAASAIFLTGRRLFGRKGGLVAAAAFIVHPVMIGVSARAYVEGGLVFFAVMAVYAAMRLMEQGETRWAVLSGVFSGLSVGCKYTAVPFTVIPVLVLVLLGGPKRPDIRNSIVLGLFCITAFAPWAVRNIVNTGNPIYPLLYNIIGGSPWNAELNARFVAAHTPIWSSPVPDTGLVPFAKRIVHFVTDTNAGTPLIMAFVPAALLLREKRRLVCILLAYFMFCAVIWFWTTHRMDRFLAVCLPSLCLMAGAGVLAAEERSRRLKWAVPVCLVISFLSVASSAVASDAFQLFFGDSPAQWFHNITRNSTYSSRAVSYINGLPEESRTLLVGEAQIYYFTGDIVYTVVFNDDILEDLINREDAVKALRQRGITHVFFNWHELVRLRGDASRKSYSYLYKGVPRPGYLPNMGFQDMKALRERLIPERTWGDFFPQYGCYPWELYRVGGTE